MGYKYISEDQLLEDLRKGDKEAFAYAYRKYWPMALSYVLKKGGTVEEAEDCYQEAFIIFLEKIREKDFVRKSKLSTFFMGIFKNLCSSRLRQRKSENDKLNKYGNEQETNPEEEEFDLPTDEEILKQIDSLGYPCKDILIYFYFNRLSMQEIADKMNIPTANAARQRKFDCMNELKGRFGV